MSLSRPEYVRRVLIALGLFGVGVVVFEVLQLAVGVLLVLFGGVLMAVLFDELGRLLSAHSPLSRTASVAVVIVALTALLVAGAWFLGPRISEQGATLTEELPKTVNQVEGWLQQYDWGTFLLEHMPDTPSEAMPQGASGVGAVESVFSTTFGLLANLVVVLFVGIYGALNPSLYIGAVERLVPPARRERASEVFRTLGVAMRSWLLGQVVSMTVVGVLTAIGLMIIGVPLALVLGLITGLLEFIPYLGPLLSAVPAALIASAQGGHTVVLVLALYGGVQFVESYLITPLVQKRAVSMPPALLISAQVVMGALVGPVGVAVATPLAVGAIVLVQMLYVEDVLGDDVEVMGGGEPKHEA